MLSSSSKRRVTAPPETHGEIEKYPCLLCHERVQNFIQWKKHVMKHEDISVYICSQCSESFINEKQWVSHCQQHNQYADELVIPIRNCAVLLCEGCGQQIHVTETEFRRSRVTPHLRLDMLRRNYRMVTIFSDKNILVSGILIFNI